MLFHLVSPCSAIDLDALSISIFAGGAHETGPKFKEGPSDKCRSPRGLPKFVICFVDIFLWDAALGSFGLGSIRVALGGASVTAANGLGWVGLGWVGLGWARWDFILLGSPGEIIFVQSDP